MKLLRTVFAAIDSLEIGVVAVIGTVLFAALVIGVPGALAWTLLAQGRPLTAALLLAVLVLSVIGVTRDLAAQRWSWLSLGMVGVWFLCTAYIAVQVWF